MWRAAVTEEEAHSRLDALLGATPRRVARHWFSLLLLALAALAATTFFVRFVTGEDSPYYSAAVERGDLLPVVSERGELRDPNEFSLLAPQAGRIIWLSPKTTGSVRKGELLARIDITGAKEAIAIEASGAAEAKAALEAATVAAQEAAARLARFEGVWRRSGGRAPSLNEMEDTRARSRRADLAVDAARAQVRAAQLRVQSRRANLAQSEVRAPADGVMVRHLVAQGDEIDEDQPLFALSSGRTPLVVEVTLSLPPVGPPRVGTTAQVRIDSIPDQPLTARLTQLRGLLPPQPGLAAAQFTLADADPRLRSGMQATVELELPARRNVLLVPDAALAFDPSSGAGKEPPHIYVLSEDGEPRRVTVVAGPSDGTRTEIFGAGLAPGDHVIIGWRTPTTAPQDRSAP